MKYLVWLLKAAIFFTLFAFALNNQHSTTMHWFFGQYWSGPLVLIVLAAFCLGLLTGILVMLPRWWQARQQAHAAEPIVIIGHNRGIIALEAQKRLKLAADALHPLLHGFQSIQAALGRLEARVADHAGGSAHQRHRRVAGQLEAAQGQHRQQMADVQAVSRGIEAAIKRDFLLVEQGIERFGIGGLRDQAARLEVLDNGFHNIFINWDRLF